MDSDKEAIKAQLMDRISKHLDKVLETRTVTMSEIENITSEFQRDTGKEVSEGLLGLKKKSRKKG